MLLNEGSIIKIEQYKRIEIEGHIFIIIKCCSISFEKTQNIGDPIYAGKITIEDASYFESDEENPRDKGKEKPALGTFKILEQRVLEKANTSIKPRKRNRNHGIEDGDGKCEISQLDKRQKIDIPHHIPSPGGITYTSNWTKFEPYDLNEPIVCYVMSRTIYNDGNKFFLTICDRIGSMRAEVDKIHINDLDLNTFYKITGAFLIYTRNLEKRLSILSTSHIEKVTSNEQFKFEYSFNRFEQLSEKKDEFVDVIGIIVDIGDIDVMKKKNEDGELMRRVISIADDNDYILRITVWGQLAENFDSKFVLGDVLALKDVMCKEFRTEIMLSMSESNVFEKNPSIDEYYKLKQWYEMKDDNNRGYNCLLRLSNIKDVISAVQIQGEPQIVGAFTGIICKINADMLIQTICSSCKRSVQQSNGEYLPCNGCPSGTITSCYKLRVQQVAEDEDSDDIFDVDMVAYHEVTTKLLGDIVKFGDMSIEEQDQRLKILMEQKFQFVCMSNPGRELGRSSFIITLLVPVVGNV